MYHIQYNEGDVRILQTREFSRWLSAIGDSDVRAQIVARIRRLGLGHRGDWKRIDEWIAELRIHHGPGYRVYFTTRRNEIIVLLAGGDKRSQRRDIDRARALATKIGELL